MRVLKASLEGPVVPTQMPDVGRVLLENCLLPNWPHQDTSIELFAVMNWPNDERRRKLFTAAHSIAYASPEWHDALNLTGIDDQPIDFRALGQSTLDLLGPEYKGAQERWKNAGDLLLTLFRLDATQDTRIRGGTSIAKAKDLLEASDGGANRQRSESDLADFKDVAHLAAAACYLSSLAFEQVGDHPDITLATPIFADPVLLLCLAQRFQFFGLDFVPHGRKESILPANSLWRVPELFPAALFGPGTLTEDEIGILAARKAGRGLGKPTRSKASSLAS